MAAFANCIAACLGTKYGAGKHIMDTPFSDLTPFFKTQYVTLICYQLTCSATKISLCVMYLRIFGTTFGDKAFLWFQTILQILTLIALEFFGIFNCNPIKATWDLTIQKKKCVDSSPGFWASLSVGLFTDVALLLYSAWKIRGLQMRARQKVALLATVGLGWVIVIASIIRGVRISAVIADSSDASWRSYETSIWSAVEVNVALMCAAAPALKPLLQKIAPKLMYSLSGKTSNTYGQSGRRTDNNGTAASRRDNNTNNIGAGGSQIELTLENKNKAEDGIFKSTQITVTEAPNTHGHGHEPDSDSFEMRDMV